MMLRSYEKEAAEAILNSPITTLHKTEIEHPKWYHFFTTAAALAWADNYDSEKYRIAKNAHPIISKIPPMAYRFFIASCTIILIILFFYCSITNKTPYVLIVDMLIGLSLVFIILFYSEAPTDTIETFLMKKIESIITIFLLFFPNMIFQGLALYMIIVAIRQPELISPEQTLVTIVCLSVLSFAFKKLLSINPLTIGITSKRFFVFFKVINPVILSIVLFSLAIYTQINEEMFTMRMVNTAVLAVLGTIFAAPLTQYRHIEKSISTLIRTIYGSQINLQTIQYIHHDSLVDSALSLDNLFAEKVFGVSVPNTGMFLLETRINILLYFDSIAHAQQMNQIHYRETANNNSDINIHCKILEDYITLLIARYANNNKYQKALTKQTQRSYIKLQSVPVDQQIRDLNSFLYNIAKYLQ